MTDQSPELKALLEFLIEAPKPPIDSMAADEYFNELYARRDRYQDTPSKPTDTEILEISLKKVTQALDNLITATDKGLTKRDIAQARAVLPSGYVNSFEKNQ